MGKKKIHSSAGQFLLAPHGHLPSGSKDAPASLAIPSLPAVLDIATAPAKTDTVSLLPNSAEPDSPTKSPSVSYVLESDPSEANHVEPDTLTKSPSVSRTLGIEDTDSENSIEKPKNGNRDANGDKNSAVKAPWVNLFKDNREMDVGLKLRKIENQPDELILSEQDIDNVEVAWGYCLVGYFAGRFPGKIGLLHLCKSWKVRYKYFIHRSGWLIFKFDSEADRARVLMGGPHLVYGRPLMLKNLPKCFEFDKNDGISTVPTWITLPGLPLDCWNPNALSQIASKVGTPLTTDRITADKGRPTFARVLVEVDITEELVYSIAFRLPTGSTRVQPVIYEQLPKYCKYCKMFGHTVRECKVNAQATAAKERVEETVDPQAIPNNLVSDENDGQEQTETNDRKEHGNQTATTQAPSGGVEQNNSLQGQQPEQNDDGGGDFIEVENKKKASKKKNSTFATKGQMAGSQTAGTSNTLSAGTHAKMATHKEKLQATNSHGTIATKGQTAETRDKTLQSPVGTQLGNMQVLQQIDSSTCKTDSELTKGTKTSSDVHTRQPQQTGVHDVQEKSNSRQEEASSSIGLEEEASNEQQHLDNQSGVGQKEQNLEKNTDCGQPNPKVDGKSERQGKHKATYDEHTKKTTKKTSKRGNSLTIYT